MRVNNRCTIFATGVSYGPAGNIINEHAKQLVGTSFPPEASGKSLSQVNGLG